MKRIMTSSWSLHRTLGEVMYDWSETRQYAEACVRWGRRDFPFAKCGQLAKRDIGMLEICHFHLPQTEGAYIRELRSELDAHEIDLYSVLIDAGDVAHPDPEHARLRGDLGARMAGLAAELGARCARVIAGDAPPAGSGPIEDDPVVCASAESFRELARSARQLGIGSSTENFRSLAVTSTPCPPCSIGARGKLVYVQTSGTLRGQKNTPIFPSSYRGQPPCTPRLISMPKAKWTSRLYALSRIGTRCSIRRALFTYFLQSR